MAAEKKQETEVKSVKMADGRTQDFSGKRNVTSESFVNPDGTIYLVTDFSNGQTITTNLPANLKDKAAGHGLKQKVHDSFAGEKSVGDMYEAANEMKKQIEEGNWNAKREAGGFSGASLVIKALCEVTGKTMDQVREFLQKKLDAGKNSTPPLTRSGLYASFRKNEKVRAVIQRLEAERDDKEGTADADAALSELASA